MSKNVETLKNDLLKYKFNPAAMSKLVIDLIEEMSLGKVEFVDVTNPVVATISSCAAMVSSFITETHNLSRKLYPYSAQTFNDLYNHMSDKDYHNLFAVPAYTEMILVFNYDELMNKLVYDATDDVYRLVIPRNTKIKLNDLVFSIQYPIIITKYKHGGISVKWDNSKAGAYDTITETDITWNIITTNNTERLFSFIIKVSQFDIITKMLSVNKSSKNTLDIQFTDQFSKCVCYNLVNDEWVNIPITYSEEIYSHLNPTIQIKILDNVVRLNIPQIYVNEDKLIGTIRVDIYTTKGKMDLSLVNYTTDSYEVEWLAIDSKEINEFTAPLKIINQVNVYSNSVVRGGNDRMTFNEVYNRVITNNMGHSTIPITDSQLTHNFDIKGFKLNKILDNLTNRVFLATRSMPNPNNKLLLTNIGSTVEMFNDTIDNISTISTVLVNGHLTTILPSSYYKLTGSSLSLVRDEELENLKLLSKEELVLAVYDRNYLFSPFHYVLDTSNSEFNIRVYYLDKPKINYRNYIGQNDTAMFQVTTSLATIQKVDSGYHLFVKTKSNDTYKQIDNSQIYVQLSVDSDSGTVHLNGELFSIDDEGERTFKFNLTTNYAIDSNDGLQFTCFKVNSNNDNRVDKLDLNKTFNITYSTSHVMPADWKLSQYDKYVNTAITDVNAKAITHENISITFGNKLNHIWSQARSVISEKFYEQYTVDIPATYEEDVYERDAETGTIFSIVDDKIVYNIKHRKGEVVIDEVTGKPKIKHRKGDIKYDIFGNPVVTSPRKIRRQFDVLLLDGTYRMTNNKIILDYIDDVVFKMVTWIIEDIPKIDNNLLELTNIYFSPIKNLGMLDIVNDDGDISRINANQSINITLHVTPNIYNNDEMMKMIRDSIILSIHNSLNSKYISISNITNELRKILSDEVLSIDIKGFGREGNIKNINLVKNNHLVNIKKKLKYQNDGTLTIDEDININFVKTKLNTKL